MRIVVLIKQVPADLSVSMNADFTINRNQTQKITNPADQSALTMAVDLKRRLGGTIACITMGPPAAASCLKDAAVAGADELYHVCDTAAAGADTLITATVLEAAIQKIGGADIVLCGRHTIDGETGQVGPELAVMLDCACLSQVMAIQSVENEQIICSCLSGSSIETYKVHGPAVLCVCENKAAAVLPSLMAMRRAASMPIHTFTLADLKLEGVSGRKSSPTKVNGVHYKMHERRHTKWLEKNEAVPTVAEVISKRSVGQ